MWFFPCFIVVMLVIGVVSYFRKNLDVFNLSFILSNIIFASLLLNVYFTTDKTDIGTALFFAFCIFYVFVVPFFTLIITLLVTTSKKFITR